VRGSEIKMDSVQKIAPLIWVSDIQTSTRFYCEKLGFSCHDSWKPNGMLKWCSLGLGNLSLMLQQYDGEAEFKKPEGIDLYIVCDDVEPLHKLISSKGARVTPISVEFYGMKQFFVTDPDGNNICFESMINQ
tara:strand:+ start:57 stop:452 length:396 start_codon:yes stop_codon:yes gene_type:complete